MKKVFILFGLVVAFSLSNAVFYKLSKNETVSSAIETINEIKESAEKAQYAEPKIYENKNMASQMREIYPVDLDSKDKITMKDI